MAAAIPLHDRMRGCLMGLMCGDALGAPLEFKSKEDLQNRYPQGIRGMVSGWGRTEHRQAGDITDDSEMALALLRSLLQCPSYSADRTRTAYLDWHLTSPEDEGITTARALDGIPSPESQANGALMRIAPLAIVSLLVPEMDWQQAAAEDAAITHMHPKCAHANIIFVESLRLSMMDNNRQSIYHAALARAQALGSLPLLARLEAASATEPDDQHHAGWVEIAFHTAYYQLLHARDFPSALCGVVNRLGDPDTNGSITGALLGALFGLSSIPTDWQQAVLQGSISRPERYRAAYGMRLINELLQPLLQKLQPGDTANSQLRLP